LLSSWAYAVAALSFHTQTFEVRKDAAAAVRAYAEKGYKIIYLSTRASWLSAGVSD